jgi:uroporphyrinogen decarboxylase
MSQETMSPRERWLAVLTRQKPDRIPMDYRATEEATARVLKHLGLSNVEEMFRYLHIDAPIAVGPRYVGPPTEAGTDVFGCKYKTVSYGIGAYYECVSHPLATFGTVEEIEKNYTWPKPDWYSYSDIPQSIQGKEDWPIQGGGSEPFLTNKNLRGDEQAFMDLILNPEIVHYCLDKLFELSYENTLRIFEQIPGQVLISYVAEDMGSETGLICSPPHIREFFIPGMKRMIDLVHQAGAFVFHHNDGAIRNILPDMIEAGIDVLDPVQWRAKGMEREDLERDFGNELIFHGGVDNQYTLAFGSVEEVRQEVIDNIRILGASGGYILGPCHNIQAVSPPENVVEMYETGYEYGWT